jgi:hypothetical protein
MQYLTKRKSEKASKTGYDLRIGKTAEAIHQHNW